MNRCARHFSFLAFLLAALGCGGGSVPKASFKPSKETTFITEPVDKDGYLDYETALNERLRGKITPETNANVLLWQALGPKPEGQAMHADYWKWLGVKPPPEDGEYFIGLRDYLSQNGHSAYDKSVDLIETQLMGNPWSANEYRVHVTWLKRNEKPLELIRQATLRTDYYNPLVSRSSNGERGLIIQASLSNVQKTRLVVDAFAMRAMVKTFEGKTKDATEDLLTIHRLARTVAKGGTMLELLVGSAHERKAYRSGLAFIEKSNPQSAEVARYKSGLRDLEQISDVTAALNRSERLAFLDMAQATNKYGFRILDDSQGNGIRTNPDRATLLLIDNIDWNIVYSTVSETLNRCTRIMENRERSKRVEQFAELSGELRQLKKELGDISEIQKNLIANGETKTVLGKKTGQVLITHLLPDLNIIQNAMDRSVQLQRNLQLAFALAAYRADHGKYPAQLADLAPKYIDKVPLDYFTDKPLIYKPNGAGYLLYSVGENGQDDGGASFDDDPKGDDLTVRMPASKPMDK